MLKTVVIGAGPAGLLFSLIGKIRLGDAWEVTLFDKRATYVRTHRLRLAREPYLEIQAELRDARFDRLIDFLGKERFSPEVNRLEAVLTELVAELGVVKTVREVTSLDDIQADTIVAADSVHSVVRELVRGGTEAERRTHERIARLRVVGPELPARLNVVDQFRLSKVLGSVVDYRRNANGFAEVDLFLTQEAHALAHALGASPREPVEITGRQISRLKAPLLAAVVEHLEAGGRRVFVQSTFELEHTVMPRVSFEAAGKRVFLLGDAAASLPFFRGMACLARCAQALVHAHASGRWGDYDRDVAAIVRREIAVVRARALTVRGLRELVRLSSLLPFPIQSWWLSAGRERAPDRAAPSTYFNLAIAVVAAACVALGLVSPWFAVASVPVELAGGVAYRWTLGLEPGPHRYVRRIWEVQVALILGVGIVLAVLRLAHPFAAAWWFVLGVAFAGGIYAFEWFVASRLAGAELDDDASS